jgi:NAD(P)-dependent dehydrogenase (short-subunit alcohol dehydrogenase family)
MDAMEPAGRHALVTGGGIGIGNAVARALMQAGAKVTILGRREVTLSEAVRSGHASAFEVADVTDPDALARAIAAAQDRLGPISILVNNAGAAESAPFARTGRAMWDRMIAVNLTSVYETTHALLPGMVASGWGRVVNIASTAGLAGYAYVSAYVAAKHGVVGLTRALALECAKSGVTVNAVCPGFTDTALVSDSIARIAAKTGRAPEAALADLTRANPQGRLVTPDEVAAAVLFLCSAGASAMNGQSVAVAGGEVM